MPNHRPPRRSLADARLLAFACAVRERFPGCPLGEELRVARFACRPRTSRVGTVSTWAGYQDEAVELSVVAHLRHRFTDYESCLTAGQCRDEARASVRADVSRLLREWRRSV
jgi:hypothetical protein